MKRRKRLRLGTQSPDHHHLDRRAGDIANASEGPPDQLIDTKALAAWLGVSPQWCELGRTQGYGPPFVKLSPQRVRYRRGAVLDWLEEREKK